MRICISKLLAVTLSIVFITLKALPVNAANVNFETNTRELYYQIVTEEGVIREEGIWSINLKDNNDVSPAQSFPSKTLNNGEIMYLTPSGDSGSDF